MIKSLNKKFELEDSAQLEERLANELEERLELACWIDCTCNSDRSKC